MLEQFHWAKFDLFSLLFFPFSFLLQMNGFPPRQQPQQFAVAPQSGPQQPRTGTSSYPTFTSAQPEQRKPAFQACYRCGRKHDCRQCPARNVTCNYCQKLGHLERVCNSKNAAVHAVVKNSPSSAQSASVTAQRQPSDVGATDATADFRLRCSVPAFG